MRTIGSCRATLVRLQARGIGLLEFLYHASDPALCHAGAGQVRSSVVRWSASGQSLGVWVVQRLIHGEEDPYLTLSRNSLLEDGKKCIITVSVPCAISASMLRYTIM